MSSRQELTEQQINDLKQAFDLFDKVGRGTITAKDVRIALIALDFEVSKDDSEKLVNGQEIDFSEFLKIIDQKINEADSQENVRRAFEELSQGRDYITQEQLLQAAKDVREPLTNEEAKKLIKVAQKGKDKDSRPPVVTFKEFQKIVTKHLM